MSQSKLKITDRQWHGGNKGVWRGHEGVWHGGNKGVWRGHEGVWHGSTQ